MTLFRRWQSNRPCAASAAALLFLRRDAEGAQLARRIETGMAMMIRDGSLHALLQHYKGDIIARAAMTQRRVIRRPNPRLTPQTPLSRGELWFNPLTGK